MREVTCRVGDVVVLDDRTRLEVLGVGAGWTEVAVTVAPDGTGYGGSYDTYRLVREDRGPDVRVPARRPRGPAARGRLRV